MKRWLAYFFLLIFSFQALPIKALGKVIAKRQMTEEVKSDCGGDGGDDVNDSDDDNLETLKEACLHNHPYSEFAVRTLSRSIFTYRHVEEDLPNSHVKDIHCPPPNC